MVKDLALLSEESLSYQIIKVTYFVILSYFQVAYCFKANSEGLR